MGLRINTNIQALNAHKNLTKTDGMLSESLGRLSSGLRINKAADDASGLAIADTLRAQHTGIGQAVSNASDGVNIIQIADGALEESVNIVNTIRTKAIQAASDAQSDTSRKAIQADVDKLLEELNMIAETTAYNGINLLDGTFTDKQFHIGAYKDETAKISIGNASGEVVGAMAYAKTDRLNEAAVSDPFMQGSIVTGEDLGNGDLVINGTLIGASSDHVINYDGNAETVTASTAMAKAQAINDKLNETGVQAKATTESVVALASGTNFAGTINGVTISAGNAVDNSSELVSFINNNGSLQKMGITAESVTASQTRIIASDGRELEIAATARMDIGGVNISGATHSNLGKLTLSNARAMVSGNNEVTAGNINAGELVINGVDIAAGGALTVTANDDDRTLVNAINNNNELQKMGIRAELYNPDGDGSRIRLISERDEITISGTDPNKVANLTSGTTEGIRTTELKITGSPVDTDTASDNYLVKIGLSGSRYGAAEEDGVNNAGGNDILYFGKDRLQFDSGDVSINGVIVGQPSDDGISHAMGDRSAAAWAEAVNSISDQTGVEADIVKAQQTGAGMVTEGVLQQGDLKINGVDIVRDNTGGAGMAIKDGDAGDTLINAINEYKDQTGVIASKDADGKLVLSARDGRNIHVESTANGNKLAKFAADFGSKGVAQDSVVFGNIRLVSNEQFTVDGAGSSASTRELSLLKMGLSGGGATTEATSDMKGDGTILAGLNYQTAIANVDVTTQEGAEMAIRTADYALERLDEIRSGLGSTQNQLTSTIANLSVTKINVQATESGIRDVDFAAESTTFSKMQVLMQAGTYAQSQANATSQNVMRLLQ